MFDDLTNNSPKPNKVGHQTNAAIIKAWARKHWELPEDATLMVSELQCGETDCPDVETVIALLSVPGANKTVKINKGIAHIDESDIQAVDIWKNPLA